MVTNRHRTVDRIAATLDYVARHPRGLTLSALAQMLEAPKSSAQSLINGLVTTGYLVRQGHLYFLGPAPFVLTLLSNPLASRIRHEDLAQLHQEIGQNVLVGIQVGDTLVYIDQAGDGAMMEFLAYHHSRRPLLVSATGKIILANLPSRELQGLLSEFAKVNPSGVDEFVAELPEISRTGVAYNRGGTIPGLYAAATGLFDAQGRFIAGICVNGGLEIADDLEVISKKLVDAVRSWRM